MDVSRVTRTAGALALGLMKFDPSLKITGFIINRAGSASYGDGVSSSIEAATGKRCFGWIPRDPGLTITERHLGLLPAGESGQWQEFPDAARMLIDEHLDVEALLHLASHPVTTPMENWPALKSSMKNKPSLPLLAMKPSPLSILKTSISWRKPGRGWCSFARCATRHYSPRSFLVLEKSIQE